jgi:menaquinone-dependent protoporphyrinogen IX oxidase
MKTLVVFYSRTGHTRDIGHRIAAALHADMEELGDRTNRRGIVGYLRSGRDAWFGRRAELLPLTRDPGVYDLIVVGTPIWNASLSTPVRTFLQDQKAKLHDVAFFCTMGRMGSARVFEQMQRESGRLPVAKLALAEYQLHSPDLPTMIRSFVYRVRAVRHAA